MYFSHNLTLKCASKGDWSHYLLCLFSLRFYLSEKVHLMCYRICVRSISAIITYHNRYGIFNIEELYLAPKGQFNVNKL